MNEEENSKISCVVSFLQYPFQREKILHRSTGYAKADAKNPIVLFAKILSDKMAFLESILMNNQIEIRQSFEFATLKKIWSSKFQHNFRLLQIYPIFFN